MPAKHPEIISAVTRDSPVENKSPPAGPINIFRTVELSDRTPNPAYHGKEKFYSLSDPNQTQIRLNEALKRVNAEGFLVSQMRFHQRENGRCYCRLTVMPQPPWDLQTQQVVVVKEAQKVITDTDNRPPKARENAAERKLVSLLQSGGAALRAIEYAPVLDRSGHYQQAFALIDRSFVPQRSIRS